MSTALGWAWQGGGVTNAAISAGHHRGFSIKTLRGPCIYYHRGHGQAGEVTPAACALVLAMHVLRAPESLFSGGMRHDWP